VNDVSGLTRATLRARLVAEAERQADRIARELGLPDGDGPENDVDPGHGNVKIDEVTRQRARENRRRRGINV
jgi:hypothetical protein